MASVKLKFDKLKAEKQITESIHKVINTNELKDELGKFAVDRIRFQVRIEEPLNDTGELPYLKDSTIDRRRYLEKYNQTHVTYREDRSSVTFTGQLMNGLGFERMKRGFRFVWKHTRKPYKTGPNSKQKGSLTNERLAGWLEEKGFVPFSRDGIQKNQKIQRQMNRIVLQFLRRFLNK